MIHALMTAGSLLALPFLVLTICREACAAFRDVFGA